MSRFNAAQVTGREMLRCLGALAHSRDSRPKLSSADQDFLDDLERATFRFFDECAHPQTGIVKHRSRADGNDDREIASIAATGFGLTALCIADQRGWMSGQQARERVLVMLRYPLHRGRWH